MLTLSEDRIRTLLVPYLSSFGSSLELATKKQEELWPLLAAYLDLLLRWNARTNLTSVRDPEIIVQRHFGESLFAAAQLAPCLRDRATVLDLGSGAGFPGIPIQLVFPEIEVTLAESQGKKAAFLREVVRALGLSSEVWANRAEAMPEQLQFDAVTLRAVDRMEAMVQVGWTRVRPGGVLLEMTVGPVAAEVVAEIPNATNRVVAIRRRP